MTIAFGVSCGGPETGPPPNVILVTLDTTRADRFSIFGAPDGVTPNFDALGVGGFAFANAVSSSAVTPVSHATILTGQFQTGHGLRVMHADSGFVLPDDKRTLVTALKEQGYTTGAIHSAFPVSNTFGFARDFDHFDSFEAQSAKERKGHVRWKMQQRRSDETTKRVLQWMEETEGPFFLWIHYWDPHDPVLLPPEQDMTSVQRNSAGQYVYDGVYQAEVSYLDKQFGRVVQALKESERYEQTLLAVTADHGEGLVDGQRDHGWSKHRLLYQEQLHVPLLLRIPGVSPGGVIDDLVRTADLAPTIADYLNVELDAEIDGLSLRPLMEGSTAEPRVAYSDMINGYDHNAGIVRTRPSSAFLYSAMDERWKIIYRPHMIEASELFDLDSDPDEVNNLWESEPKQRTRLLELLANRNPWVVAAFPGEGGEDGDMSAALKSLGYSENAAESDLDWAWTCPEHLDLRAEKQTRHDCGRVLIPVL